MTHAEYKTRFIARMTSQGVYADIAEGQHAAWLEQFASDIADDLECGSANPEADADEAISCWSN